MLPENYYNANEKKENKYCSTTLIFIGRLL